MIQPDTGDCTICNTIILRTRVKKFSSENLSWLFCAYADDLQLMSMPQKEVINNTNYDLIHLQTLLFCRWAVYMAFHVPLQNSLNQFRLAYNAKKIRHQKNVDLPTSAIPNVMYSNPQLYNTGKKSFA